MSFSTSSQSPGAALSATPPCRGSRFLNKTMRTDLSLSGLGFALGRNPGAGFGIGMDPAVDPAVDPFTRSAGADGARFSCRSRATRAFCASRAAVHTLPPGRTDTGVGVNSTSFTVVRPSGTTLRRPGLVACFACGARGTSLWPVRAGAAAASCPGGGAGAAAGAATCFGAGVARGAGAGEAAEAMSSRSARRVDRVARSRVAVAVAVAIRSVRSAWLCRSRVSTTLFVGRGGARAERDSAVDRAGEVRPVGLAPREGKATLDADAVRASRDSI